MKKKTLLTLATLALFLIGGAVAYADDGVFGEEGYNWEDPILLVAGSRVEVQIGAEVPDGETLSRATRVTVFVPRNAEATVLDDGGLKVKLVQAGRYHGNRVPLQVVVFKPRTDQGSSYPVTVTVLAAGRTFQVSGVAGRPLWVNAWVPAP
ncbi:MAG: hypothetical protein ACUVXG_01560 [Anaerolineae bacterium]